MQMKLCWWHWRSGSIELGVCDIDFVVKWYQMFKQLSRFTALKHCYLCINVTIHRTAADGPVDGFISNPACTIWSRWNRQQLVFLKKVYLGRGHPYVPSALCSLISMKFYPTSKLGPMLRLSISLTYRYRYRYIWRYMSNHYFCQA